VGCGWCWVENILIVFLFVEGRGFSVAFQEVKSFVS